MKERIQFCKGGGCTAKLGAGALNKVLSMLPESDADENLLVGYDSRDDAAVYRISDSTAFVQTLDFFPPMVEDPYIFGQIAAANSLSDVWAMGGEPAVALNIVGFPNCLDPAILGDILAGGADKVKEAGAVLVGGHSVQDDEPKYGLCVSGFVHPDKIFKNYGCRPGDVLVLTKQIGIGVVNTAIKSDMASQASIREAQTVIASLNKTIPRKETTVYEDPHHHRRCRPGRFGRCAGVF